MMNRSLITLLIALCCLSQATGANWMTGVAKEAITPKQERMRMGGFAHRTHGADGKIHDLWVKALALQDADGNKGVMVTFDLLGLPKNVSDEIRAELTKRYGLKRSNILLNASHTHSAPIVDQTLANCYVLNTEEVAQIESYKKQITRQFVSVVGTALKSMTPSKIYSETGVVRFQVNRRNNTEKTLVTQDELKGPNDYAVSVLKITDMNDNIKAVTFGYACHATVLDEYLWSGDWPGFAQIEIEKIYPGAMALFTQGAGADMNPLPRRTRPLAIQYGKEMSVAVERVISEKMKPLTPSLTCIYEEIDLPLDNVLSSDELTLHTTKFPATDYRHVWAQKLLDKKSKGVAIATSYPYPIQIWRLGEQNIFVFGGELTIQYAINVKKLFGSDSFVMAYSNDQMGYIPSERILNEGRYEGDTSQSVYDLPAKWAKGIEQTIMNKVVELAAKAGLTPSK